MTYYKGYLCSLKEIEDNKLLLGDFRKQGYSILADKIARHFQGANYVSNYEKIEAFLKEMNDKKSLSAFCDEKIEQNIKDYFNNIKVAGYQKIIYEKVIDQSGQLFGKEIITGYSFPIYNDAEYNLNIKEEIYYTDNYESRMYVPNKSQTRMKSSDKDVAGHVGSGIKYDFILDKFNGAGNYGLNKIKKIVYYILRKMVYSHDVLEKVSIPIIGCEPANNNEINRYQRKHRGLILWKFKMQLKKLYNENVFKRNIISKKEEVQENKEFIVQDRETVNMENIEYLIMSIRSVDNDLANKYQREYDEILENEDNNEMNLLSYEQKLIYLEGELELVISCLKRNSCTIEDYLNKLKRQYIKTMLDNEEKTSITIDEIDKMNELFLKNKKRYSLLAQRNVLKEFAFIYLFEAIENIDDIEIQRLENSYFKMHLKSIMMYIKSLIDLGLFSCNIYFELTNDVDLVYVLNIILFENKLAGRACRPNLH